MQDYSFSFISICDILFFTYIDFIFFSIEL